jgi:hypothetical protein
MIFRPQDEPLTAADHDAMFDGSCASELRDDARVGWWPVVIELAVGGVFIVAHWWYFAK